MKSTTITAIDIGTSSIKLLVGQKEANSPDITILEKREIPHFGVKRGEVYNSENVSEKLSFLKEKIQKTKGIKIKKAVVNIGGSHLFGVKNQGLVSVSRADQKISQEDIKRVIQASQVVNLPVNKEILEAIVQEYIINGEGGVTNPLGLEGIRLEVKVLLICIFSPVLQKLEKAVFDAGIEIDGIIPSILACPRAVLTEQQKELGTAVVDIGSGTTSISVFNEGALKDFAVFPMGSANITNDIAILLRTEISTAEKIKKEFGSFNLTSKKRKTKKEKIDIMEKELSFSKSFLENIIKSRISEIFFEIAKVLKKTSKETILPGGVVLTGGGSLLPGIVDFAKQKFELPCYLSGPRGLNGVEEPNFSMCAGILLSAFDPIDDNMPGLVSQEKEGIFKKLLRIFSP